jgi:hypothetical protein
MMLSLKGSRPPVTRRKHGLCCLRPRRSPPLAFHDSSRGMRLRRLHPDQIEGSFPAQPPVKPVGRVTIHDELVPATGPALRFPNHHVQIRSPLFSLSASRSILLSGEMSREEFMDDSCLEAA